ncbi:hypothetical protein [Paenibacillus sp. 23TSA30-6]|uniref:hypothetical protein n=1 Tax=Paenibacillus sp. 23TSA30-6 TaxID=2546104 RepID=UPI001787D01D|nr:hypothetical protein [Paenibacillus sp. 23TSA30-6]
MSVAELKEYVDLRVQGGLSIKYVLQRLDHKTIQKTADIYLDITEKIEEDELKKFASYTNREYESAQNRHDPSLRSLDYLKNLVSPRVTAF